MSRSWCVNYRGVGRVCDAGILPSDLIDKTRLSRDRVPCFREGVAIPCPHRRYPTPEEDAERERQMKRDVEEYFAAIDDNRCPHCGADVLKRQQVGRCVYARPCGHRLYQGTL